MILILIDDIVNKYNINKYTYHSTIKIKPVDWKSNTYIDSSKEINNKDPKFKIGSIVRISIHKSVFTKCCPPNCSEENTVPWTYLINDLNKEEIIGTFYKKELQKKKQIKKNLELKK